MGMKDTIARLRALKIEADKPENDNVPTLVRGMPMDDYILETLSALPQLLDRLEKLEKDLAAAGDLTEAYRSDMIKQTKANWQLLDRLEKLEAVAKTATKLVESAITQADILENGDIVPTRCVVDPHTFDGLQDALATLED